MNAEHDEIQNSVAAFLLGAADPEEAELVRAHLEGCVSCQELARRLQRALGALPLAVNPVSPPAELRDRILAAAAESRQPARMRQQQTRALRVLRAGVLAWPPVSGVRIAAAAIVAFALGVGLGLGLGRYVPSQVQPPSTVAQYSLSGTGSMAGAQGRVFELKQEGLTLVQFNGLPQNAPGRVYELWLISTDGHPAPAGVFAPDSNGGHVVLLPRTLAGLKALAVTEEIAPNGASAPTQQPQLVGSVA
jgi:anti-sigma-K factor RskA